MKQKPISQLSPSGKTRRRYKEQGRCVQCGNEWAGDSSNCILCRPTRICAWPKCDTEIPRTTHCIWCPIHQHEAAISTNRKSAKRRRKRNKENGLCTRCKNQHEPNKTLCTRHLKLNSSFVTANRANREDWMCTRCSQPHEPDKTMCARHLRLNARYSMASRARKINP